MERLLRRLRFPGWGGLSVMLLLPLLGACGASAGGKEAADLQLPKVTLLGDEPPSPGRYDITITGSGEMRVNGRSCQLSELLARLRPASGIRDRRLPPAPAKAAGAEPGETAESPIEEQEVDEEEVEELEEETEEVFSDAPFSETEGLSDEEVEDDGGPIDFRTADLARQNPKMTVVELPPREPVLREQDSVQADMSAPVDVFLRFDRRVPFGLVEAVLWKCADMHVQLHRLFVAVQDPETGEEGAIAVFLPIDGGFCGGRIVVGTDVRIELRARAERDTPVEPPSPDVLASELAARREQPDDALFVSLKAPALARWGDVVPCLEAGLQAGAYSLTLDSSGESFPDRTVAQWVALAAASPSHRPFLRGGPPPQSAPVALVPAGRRVGHFGFSNAVTMGYEPIINEAGEEIFEGEEEEDSK